KHKRLPPSLRAHFVATPFVLALCLTNPMVMSTGAFTIPLKIVMFVDIFLIAWPILTRTIRGKLSATGGRWLRTEALIERALSGIGHTEGVGERVVGQEAAPPSLDKAREAARRTSTINFDRLRALARQA